MALEDGVWHHENSYAHARTHKPSTVALWQKIQTVEDPVWSARYHEPDPARRAFGGRLEIVMQDGRVISQEKAVANAHPNGLTPWAWPDYVNKFKTLVRELTEPGEVDRFVEQVENLADLSADGIKKLHPRVAAEQLPLRSPEQSGLFESNA